jgi:hypothetical protein
MSFQEGIDIILADGTGVDIAVFILWARLGSPLGPRILKPDGAEYLSGTEREFHLMVQARTRSATDGNGSENLNRRPDMLVYRRVDDNSFAERLRGRPAHEQEEILRQKELVNIFFRTEFWAPDGHSLRAYEKPIRGPSGISMSKGHPSLASTHLSSAMRTFFSDAKKRFLKLAAP